MAGLSTYFGNVLSERAMEGLDLDGVGRFLALTNNDEINSLAVLQFTHIFGRSEVYQLKTRGRVRDESSSVARSLLGRILFDEKATYLHLREKFTQGAIVKSTPLTPEFDYKAFLEKYTSAIPLFLIKPHHRISVFNRDTNLTPEPGHTILSLVEAPVKPEEAGTDAEFQAIETAPSVQT